MTLALLLQEEEGIPLHVLNECETFYEAKQEVTEAGLEKPFFVGGKNNNIPNYRCVEVG